MSMGVYARAFGHIVPTSTRHVRAVVAINQPAARNTGRFLGNSLPAFTSRFLFQAPVSGNVLILSISLPRIVSSVIPQYSTFV